jgi:hypothetical protein
MQAQSSYDINWLVFEHKCGTPAYRRATALTGIITVNAKRTKTVGAIDSTQA